MHGGSALAEALSVSDTERTVFFRSAPQCWRERCPAAPAALRAWPAQSSAQPSAALAADQPAREVPRAAEISARTPSLGAGGQSWVTPASPPAWGHPPRASVARGLWLQKANRGCWALAVTSLLPSACWMLALNFMVFNASFTECD